MRALITPALDDLDARRPAGRGADRLCERLEEIAQYAERLRGLDGELDLLEALSPGAVPAPPSFKVGNFGRSANWPDVAALRGAVRDVGDVLASVRAVPEGAAQARWRGESPKSDTTVPRSE